MSYDFDRIVPRRGTDSLKYDFAAERGMPPGLLPMWVADMDFPAPPEVLADIAETAAHGIFGYTEPKAPYYDAVAEWFGGRYGYRPPREAIVKAPGVVFALAQAVRAFTAPGDAVLIQTPVYYPFYDIVRRNGRTLATNPLTRTDGAYTIDFDDFERKASENAVKAFILCNPHNPVGRVWTRGELIRLRDICAKNGILVLSDEIHCDFVWGGREHVCYAALSKDAFIATAPSKTFNLAGLQVSNVFIENASLRRRFRDETASAGYSQLNTVGLRAALSAYEKGGPWLAELKAYLEGNIRAARYFIAECLPKVTLIEPEGTYLLWLDFSAYGLTQAELDRRVTAAGLWLDSGTMFGAEGEGFQRVNAACPRSVLLEGLRRLGEV
ncbi:MAG: pyridoxal phosphate-dependent aminotransferase [Clostridiales bacterium]|jgi:cystathionine beta-lyase|nr:pyridoxal phosphate-dependent aminotransferase [Clostridiales bacterium]